MRKNLLAFALVLSVFTFAATPAFAAYDYGLGKFVNQASQAAQRQENNLERLKARADKAIENRINELNRLISRIQNDSRLSSDEKASLNADINGDISGLTALKAKIDADSDIQTARSDAQTIVTSYRIYMVIVPKIRLLITIDNLSTLNSNLQALTPKVQDLINNLKSQGKDVSKLQSLLDDINSRLSAISTALANDKTTVEGVSVSNYSAAHNTFVSVRQDLAQNVRASFAQIRNDIAQMRVDFRIIISGNSQSSPTPSTTPSP